MFGLICLFKGAKDLSFKGVAKKIFLETNSKISEKYRFQKNLRKIFLKSIFSTEKQWFICEKNQSASTKKAYLHPFRRFLSSVLPLVRLSSIFLKSTEDT